jgi:tetratricopeptide (TPR) repeat protein
MGPTHASTPAGERLDSWKEVSAYLKRDPRTLQRWEKKEGLPVRRHVHDSQVSIYAYTSELDAWLAGRTLGNGNGSASSARSVSRALLWTGAFMIAIAVAALALVVPRVRHSASVQFQSRDWIIIVPFENRTGDGLVDGTMEYALERALSQSRYVNVAPRDRINDILTLMRQRRDVKLNEDLARQVAIRDGGIKAVVGGRVEKLGSRYVLTVRLLSPRGGEPVELIEKAASKEGLLDAARSASADLRQKLGESRETRAANLEKATTPSLAALRAFSAGMELVNLRKWSLAAPLLEEAVVQDPKFATAHVYAAHCYSNLNHPEKAAPHYQAAFQLADTVTQRERLFILGSYYARFLHDDRRAIDAYTALVGLYPDDYWGANNLAVQYTRLHVLPEHMDVLEKLDASRPIQQTTMILWYYYRFDRPNESKDRQYREELRRLRQSGMTDAWGDSALDLESVSTKWLRGDTRAAAEELTTLNARVADPAQACAQEMIVGCNDLYEELIAETNLVFGKLAAARDWCDHVSNAVYRHECLSRIAYAAGDRNAAKEQLRQILTSGPTTDGAFVDAMLALWLGEIATAERWLESRPVNRQVHGWLFLARGRLQEAVDQLRDGGGAFWTDYGLACALERQKKFGQAISVLEQMRLPPADGGLFPELPSP